MHRSNLAFRLPVVLGSLVLLAGCYTMLSHPQSDVTMGSREDYRTDCGSCHTSGFDQRLLPDSYPYVASPFQEFYNTPWWLPEYGAGLLGPPGVGGSYIVDTEEDKNSREGGSEGRNVGSRGPGLPSLPGGYTPSPPESGTPGATTPASNETTPASGQGQQPGRKMKENTGDTKDAPDKPAKSGDKPSDGGGG